MSFGVLLTASRDVRYATFGVPVTLPSAAVVTGIFSSPRVLTELEKKRGGISTLELVLMQAKLELRDEDVATLEKGAVVEIGGQHYFLGEPIPNGEGETLFYVAMEPDAPINPGDWR